MTASMLQKKRWRSCAAAASARKPLSAGASRRAPPRAAPWCRCVRRVVPGAARAGDPHVPGACSQACVGTLCTPRSADCLLAATAKEQRAPRLVLLLSPAVRALPGIRAELGSQSGALAQRAGAGAASWHRSSFDYQHTSEKTLPRSGPAWRKGLEQVALPCLVGAGEFEALASLCKGREPLFQLFTGHSAMQACK